MTTLGPKNIAEIRDDFLVEIKNEAARAGIDEPTGPDSDNYVWATAAASVAMFAHARIDSAKPACTPGTSTGNDLIRWQKSLQVPDLQPSRASGKVRLRINGSATVSNGQPGTLRSGARFSVVGNWPNITDGAEVDVLVDNAGPQGNAAGGSPVRLLNPPLNVSSDATVSLFVPLIGGFGAETEASLKDRVLAHVGTNAGGLNWGHIRELARASSAAIQECYVYPAIFGPSTVKVVPVRAFDRELYSFGRALPDAALNLLRSRLHSYFSSAFNVFVENASSTVTDVTLRFGLDNSSLVGGGGTGVIDAQPWPLLSGDTRCPITAVNSAGVITVDANTTTAPVPNLARISWWSSRDMKFHVRTVVAVSGGASAWVLTLDAPFSDELGQPPQVGDYVSPALVGLENYGKTWLSLLEGLAPGENTTDPYLLSGGRAKRRPALSDGRRSTIDTALVGQFEKLHPEVTSTSISYASTSTPAVPALTTSPPAILVPRRFAIYLA